MALLLVASLVPVAVAAGPPPAESTFRVEGTITSDNDPPRLPGAPNERIVSVSSPNCGYQSIAYFGESLPSVYEFTAPVEQAGETCLYELSATGDRTCWAYLGSTADLASGAVDVPASPDAVTVDFSQATDNVIPVAATWQDNCGLVTVAIDPPPNEPPTFELLGARLSANVVGVGPGTIFYGPETSVWWGLIGAEYAALYRPPDGCTVVSENPTSGVVEEQTTILFEIDCASGTGGGPPTTGAGGAAPAAGTEAPPAQPVSSPAEFTG